MEEDSEGNQNSSAVPKYQTMNFEIQIRILESNFHHIG
jgi:hypothetical protein